MLESDLEARVVRFVTGVGGYCLKFDPKNCKGFPDRIILLPNGVTLYVELKKPAGKCKTHGKQPHWARRLTTLGHHYLLSDDYSTIREFIRAFLPQA